MEVLKPLSKPYIVRIFNDSGIATRLGVLFGYNRNFRLPNFGNLAGMIVSSGIPNVTYQQLLAQSQNQPFDIGQWQISSSNPTQQDVVPVVTWYDANGADWMEPLDINKDPYQFQQGEVDFWFPCKIDGNTMVQIPVRPLTTVTVKMYPRKIVSLSRPLIGSPELKLFKTPKISGNNTTVIIPKLTA